MPRECRLLLKYRPPASKEQVDVVLRGKTTIGSAASCNIHIPSEQDPEMAALHAVIDFDAASKVFYITDEETPVGTYVKLSEANLPFELNWDDVVRFGDARMRITPSTKTTVFELIDQAFVGCSMAILGLSKFNQQSSEGSSVLTPQGQGSSVYQRWKSYRERGEPPKGRVISPFEQGWTVWRAPLLQRRSSGLGLARRRSSSGLARTSKNQSAVAVEA